MENNIIKNGGSMFTEVDKNCEKMEKDKRIEESIKRISKALNLLEATTENLEWACDSHGWDSGVVYQIKDAARYLGFALATLNRWYDDDVMGCDCRES